MVDKSKKPQKLRARLPSGLADRGPAEITATRSMVEKIREVYERYGFEPIETPAMEYTDALGKFLPDQDRPNEGVFSFQDDDKQWISLRYDLTAPLARYVAERYGTERLVLPYRSYRHGWVFRNEKPGPGRFRQFMQFDADTVGSDSPAADAEMCMMAADTMEAMGIPRGSYVVKMNNRKVLDGVMEAIEIGGDENAGKRLTVLRAIDKLDRLGRGGVRQLLGPGRWDGGEEGKGDFTKGAGLSTDQIDRLLWITLALNRVTAAQNFDEPLRLDMQDGVSEGSKLDNFAVLSDWNEHEGSNSLVKEGIDELHKIASLCVAAGFGTRRILIDPSVVRGLEYYTGTVFEVELLLETKDEKGRPIRFGSVGGGGRYDGLVSRFQGQPVPATGFSIGVSRLQAALEELNKEKSQPPAYGPVVITVFDRDRVADYQKMVAALRNSPIDPKKPDGPKIRAELYLGSPKNMGNQFKYADKRNSPCVIVQGSNEKKPGKGRKPRVIVKDLVLGAKMASVSGERADYLAKQNEAQASVLEKHLVKEVRKILTRHGVKWT
jgi:histidyl-tRNA synthetase